MKMSRSGTRRKNICARLVVVDMNASITKNPCANKYYPFTLKVETWYRIDIEQRKKITTWRWGAR